jgi:hypothetical protein
MKINHGNIQKFIRWASIALFVFACAYKFKRIIDSADGKEEKDSLPPNPNDKVDGAEVPEVPEDDDDDDDDGPAAPSPAPRGIPTSTPQIEKSAEKYSNGQSYQTGSGQG